MKAGPADVVQSKWRMKLGEQIKHHEIYFDPKKFKTIEILALTDVQFGHLACKVERFIEFRDWVLREPNRFVFFLGDMVLSPLRRHTKTQKTHRARFSSSWNWYCQSGIA